MDEPDEQNNPLMNELKRIINRVASTNSTGDYSDVEYSGTEEIDVPALEDAVYLVMTLGSSEAAADFMQKYYVFPTPDDAFFLADEAADLILSQAPKVLQDSFEACCGYKVLRVAMMNAFMQNSPLAMVEIQKEINRMLGDS
jgi:hypothetical protein